MSPNPLPADVIDYARAGFAPGEADAALGLLAGAVTETGAAASPRLLRAAAVAAGGNLGRLREYVALLAIDWRDVIVAGEYASVDGALARVR